MSAPSRRMASTITLSDVFRNDCGAGRQPITAIGGQLYSQAICGMRAPVPSARVRDQRVFQAGGVPLPLSHGFG